MILCIETATNICSVAIAKDGVQIANHTLEEGQRHSSQLSVIIEACLTDVGIQHKDLLAIAISNGPGSYTGLRVGASTAKGLCYGLDIPLIAIPSLQCISSAYANDNDVVMAAIDARRMEAYTAIYQQGKEIRAIGSTIWTAEVFADLVSQYQQLIICGDGIAKVRGEIIIPGEIQIKPNLADSSLMCAIAHQKYTDQRFANIAYHSPLYYKSPKITTPKRSLRAKQ